MEIAIADSIEIVGILINVNRQSNLESEFDSTSSIRFGDPNRISLGKSRQRIRKTFLTLILVFDNDEQLKEARALPRRGLLSFI